MYHNCIVKQFRCIEIAQFWYVPEILQVIKKSDSNQNCTILVRSRIATHDRQFGYVPELHNSSTFEKILRVIKNSDTYQNCTILVRSRISGRKVQDDQIVYNCHGKKIEY